jgi:type IV pilus assembly protein PilW
MGCDVLLPAVAGRANISFKAMAPVTINSASIPAGDPNTDTVLVVYGNSQGGPEGNLITAHVTGANTYTVDSARSFSVGDLVIAGPQARPSPCLLALDRVNGVDNVLNKVTVSAGAPGNMINGRLYNLGQAPKMLVYAIRGGNLTLCDYMANDCGFAGNVGNPAVWLPVAGNIVSLRAQYGRDTTAPNMDGIVDVYDQASPATSCDWARVAAVRLVLVARNSQPAKTGGVHNDGVVTDAAPAWAGSANNPVDLSATEVPAGFSWQNYRYKTFETVISIRNMAQSGAQAGC